MRGRHFKGMKKLFLLSFLFLAFSCSKNDSLLNVNDTFEINEEALNFESRDQTGPISRFTRHAHDFATNIQNAPGFDLSLIGNKKGYDLKYINLHYRALGYRSAEAFISDYESLINEGRSVFRLIEDVPEADRFNAIMEALNNENTFINYAIGPGMNCYNENQTCILTASTFYILGMGVCLSGAGVGGPVLIAICIAYVVKAYGNDLVSCEEALQECLN